MPAADTHETFILKVTKLLMSRYTLGSTIYIDAKTEMDIHCQKHGWFTQKAGFLRSTRTKYHCDDCLTDHLTDRSGDDTKSWIAKAEAVFTENEYNFDNTIYVDSLTKVEFLCNRCEKKKEYLLTELTLKFPDYIFDLSVFTALHKNISYTCDKGHKRKGVPNNLKSGKTTKALKHLENLHMTHT